MTRRGSPAQVRDQEEHPARHRFRRAARARRRSKPTAPVPRRFRVAVAGPRATRRRIGNLLGMYGVAHSAALSRPFGAAHRHLIARSRAISVTMCGTKRSRKSGGVCDTRYILSADPGGALRHSSAVPGRRGLAARTRAARTLRQPGVRVAGAWPASRSWTAPRSVSRAALRRIARLR